MLANKKWSAALKIIQKVVAIFSAFVAGPSVGATDAADDKLWQQVYDARVKAFESAFGKLPQDILKLGDLTGVWPGGGLFVIPAGKLGNGIVVYTTFGLSNPDMPTQVTVSDVKTEVKDNRVVRNQGILKKKENIRPRTIRPGYGYEVIVVAKENSEWPLWLLQWAVKAELLGDADILGRVEKYHGLTVEKIEIGQGRSVNLLFAKALPPLLASIDLPNGRADILVATVIADEEMQWSMKNGRDSLLEALRKAGVGQVSVLSRHPVVQ
jgi:hypothetical protein